MKDRHLIQALGCAAVMVTEDQAGLRCRSCQYRLFTASCRSPFGKGRSKSGRI